MASRARRAVLDSYQIMIDRRRAMADIATLSSKFQISIPKSVREHQHWKAGQKLVFVPKGNGVLLVPAPALDDLRGIARGADPENYRDRDDRV
jgi:AbrB family looped-hinge helix DNA binding protein